MAPTLFKTTLDKVSLRGICVRINRSSCRGVCEMTSDKKTEKELRKIQKKKQKKNALIMCHDGKEYWTTQAQFWQWVRESVVLKVSDGPLRGQFIRQNEEYNVVISNTILNIKCPNHLREALISRRNAYR